MGAIRLLFYSHDTFGLGHFRRSLTIASHLRRHLPDTSALIMTGLGWLFILRRRSYQSAVPANYGEMPGEAVEAGETPAPAPSYADVAGQFEPVSLVDEKTVI